MELGGHVESNFCQRGDEYPKRDDERNFNSLELDMKDMISRFPIVVTMSSIMLKCLHRVLRGRKLR